MPELLHAHIIPFRYQNPSSVYGDSYYKEKTVIMMSYLYNCNPYTSKKALNIETDSWGMTHGCTATESALEKILAEQQVSGYGLNQWETTLPRNVVSRWLSPYPDRFLLKTILYQIVTAPCWPQFFHGRCTSNVERDIDLSSQRILK